MSVRYTILSEEDVDAPRTSSVTDEDPKMTWLPRRLEAQRTKAPRLSKQTLIGIIIITISILMISALVFFVRTAKAHKSVPEQQTGSASQVPLTYTTWTFRFNESFAAPPVASGSAEPIWDSLIPNGLGYVSEDPLSGQDFSVISAFHQLHCLYTLRRAYYSSSSSGGEDFDFGLDRTHHAEHCFEYLRQSLMCSADSTIEPAENADQGFLGWGFERKCKNYRELKDWAERWRAFDGHGFLSRPENRHERR